DLGSGDGRTVITAAQRGIRALGIEYDPNLVQLSKENAAKAGVADKATFTKADIFESDFSSATVITLFLLPDLNLRLRPILLGMKPGTRVVSNTFTMGEWEADERATVDNPEACKYWCTAYLWVVPAKAEGRWNSPAGRIELKQTFQKVEGSLQAEGRAIVIADGRLRGDQISFRAGGASYSGRVAGDRIEGTVTGDGGPRPWVATKAQ
ncbi:MAG TPA: methyltransferase domain-containing protein, partial [Burkholderiales bacterium]|nr:methyltransferase domain-containing protein [Burkholderiales bacterium]